VIFNPLCDFETQGCLRNIAKEKDPDIVRRLEHASFMTGIDAALDRVAKIATFNTEEQLTEFVESFPRTRTSSERGQ
jgi:cell filamentation protein